MRLPTALAILAVALASGTGLALADTSKTVGCKRAGIHYVGTTSQSQKVCFTLTRTGKSLVQFSFSARFKCEGGTEIGVAAVGPTEWSVNVPGEPFFSTSTGSSGPIAKLEADGSFVYGIRSYKMLTEFKGKIARSGVAKGTLRQVFAPYSDEPAHCNTGVARWTARRAAK